MLYIAIVDDIQKEIERISGVINEYVERNDVSIDVKTFGSAEELLSDYRPFQYTLIFLDIYMDGMTGVDAAKKIRETDSDTLIVFLTSSADHTFDAFNVHAYQYLLKDPSEDTLKTSIFRVLDELVAMQAAAGASLTVSSEGEEIEIAFSRIVYAQSQKNYIQITDKINNTYRTRMTFSEISGKLSSDSRFLQINRGIIINMDYITSFGKETCELEGGHSFPINVREQKKLDQIRKNYIFSKLHNRRNEGGIKS